MIYLRRLFDLYRIVLVVRHGVVAVGNADRAIAAVATLARDHATDDAGHIGLIGDHHEVHHQPGVIVELLRDRTRPLHYRQLHSGALLFGLLNAALDVANGVQVLGQLAAIGCAQPAFQPADVRGHVIENDGLLVQASQPGRRVGAVGVAEEALEDRARVHFHGIGRGGAAPGNGGGIGATVTGIAVD